MNYRLPVTVFLTGMAVLVMEVVGVRILSPFFGNTIFTFSSVLSVVLAALSGGYWYGGIKADSEPSFELFYRYIIASGLAVLAGALVARVGLPFLGILLPLTWGPLVSAVIFFGLPAFVLGMLSPYAVALEKRAETAYGVGRSAGTIFFWSTLGSIAGSLGSGFFLIPHFSTFSILYGVGFGLLFLGMWGLRWVRGLTVGEMAMIFALPLVFGTSALWFAGPLRQMHKGTVRFQSEGVYSQLTVLERDLYGQPGRLLVQDRSMSSGIFLESDELPFPYTHYYKLADHTGTKLSRALILGAGTFTMADALVRELPHVQVDVVDIEPSLETIAYEWFNVEPNERIRFSVADAREYVRRPSESYNLIFGDVYQSLFSIPSHVVTAQFFEEVKGRLAPGGIFVGNIIGSVDNENPSVLGSVLKTIQEVFPHVELFAVQNPKEPEQFQNFVVLASTDSSARFNSWPLLRQFKKSVDFSATRIPLPVASLEKSILLSDAYAPVEYLGMRSLEEANR